MNHPDILARTITDIGKLELFDKLIDVCGKCYNLSENLTLDKVTVLFSGRVIFQ
jgi:hypothetical protein